MTSHTLRTVHIDSRYRVSGSASDFKFQLRDTLDLQDGTRCHIDNVRFTDCWPTITLQNRNIFFSDGNHGVIRYQLSLGAYSGSQIALEIQNKTGYTTTYNTNENTLTIFNPGHPLLSDNDLAYTIIPSKLPAGVNPYQPFSINSLLGYPDNADVGTNYVTFEWVNMQPYSEVYLRSQILRCHGIHGHAMEHDILLSIPLTTGFGTIVKYDMPSTTWHDTHHINTTILDFQLTDKDGNTLPLSGGNNASISFVLTFDN